MPYVDVRTNQWLAFQWLFLCLIAGCHGGRPSDAPVLGIDPIGAANAAIEQFDKDKSGDLSQVELETCGGLASLFPQIDSDSNGTLSAEELAGRFRFWVESPTRIAAIVCQVVLDGRPLAGATVRFVPEGFLGGKVMAGSGVTDPDGKAMLRVPDADLPPELQGIRGMQLGIYHVEITHPEKQIPAKYNSETTLNREVNPASTGIPFHFNLKS